MLDDKDRIFTNVYGFQPWNLDAAQKRGDWDNTKALMARGEVPKPGPQGVNRRTSDPEGGVTSLQAMVSENHDYRGEWS